MNYVLTLAAGDTIQAVAGTASAITYSIYGTEVSDLLGRVSKLLAQGQVPTSAGVLYPVPSLTTAFISGIVLTETIGSAPVNGIVLYSGGTAASNQLTGTFSLPAFGRACVSASGFNVTDSRGNIYRYSSNAYQFDSVAPGVTTPVLASISGSATQAARRDHQHQSPGCIAALSSTSAGINTPETTVLSATIPANFMQAGTVFRVRASGTGTTTVANSNQCRIRIGTAGTSSDTSVSIAVGTAGTTGTNIPFCVELYVIIRTAGVSGTAAPGASYFASNSSTGLVNAGVPQISQPTSTTTVNTTVQNIIQLAYSSAASTTTATFYDAVIEVVKM